MVVFLALYPQTISHRLIWVRAPGVCFQQGMMMETEESGNGVWGRGNPCVCGKEILCHLIGWETQNLRERGSAMVVR